MQLIYYLFFTRPNPFLAALDFYFLRPLADNTANKWSSSNFVLREKLGGGNFGAAFEGVKLEVGVAVINISLPLVTDRSGYCRDQFSLPLVTDRALPIYRLPTSDCRFSSKYVVGVAVR